MARNCNVCEHKERVSIEKQIVKGYSKNKIASEFNVPEYSLRYHEEHHLSRQLKKAYEIKAQENGLDVFSELENMILDIKTIVEKAKSKNHDAKFLAAARELRSSLELLSKIKFAMNQHGEGGYLTDGEKRSKRAQLEYDERLTADIEKNLDNLTEEEKSAYHQIIIKLINGHKNRITHIRYADNANIPIHNFKDTTEYKANVVDDDDEPTEPMKRTKPAKQDDDPDDPTTWGPIEPIEIPYTPWAESELNPRRRRR